MNAIFLVFFILSLLVGTISHIEKSERRTGVMAENFIIYRNAVFSYALSAASLSDGTIATGSLSLPRTWQATSVWNNQVLGNQVYAWGRLDAQGRHKMEELANCSQTYFYSNGFATSAICSGNAGPTLPIAIPQGSIVSILEVH